MSPPANSILCESHIVCSPEYSLSINLVDVDVGSPNEISAKYGVPPIAAMSLMLTAMAFRPNWIGEIVFKSKWIDSMSASVDVSCTVFGRVEKTAQSSPIPFFIRGEWVLSLERSRSISPNSPNCFKLVAFFMKEESLETLLKNRCYINLETCNKFKATG